MRWDRGCWYTTNWQLWADVPTCYHWDTTDIATPAVSAWAPAHRFDLIDAIVRTCAALGATSLCEQHLVSYECITHFGHRKIQAEGKKLYRRYEFWSIKSLHTTCTHVYMHSEIARQTSSCKRAISRNLQTYFTYDVLHIVTLHVSFDYKWSACSMWLTSKTRCHM